MTESTPLTGPLVLSGEPAAISVVGPFVVVRMTGVEALKSRLGYVTGENVLSG
jgi:hypothetical protein